MKKTAAAKKVKKTGRITDATVAAKKAAMILAFIETASITVSCASVGINRERHYTWKSEDPEYAAQFAVRPNSGNATDKAAERLIDEATRRAHLGRKKAVIYKGAECWEYVRDEFGKPVKDPKTRKPLMKQLFVVERSDNLLMFLIKRYAPDFRESWKGEISGPNGGPIAVTDAFLESLSDEQLQQLHSIAEKLASVGGDRGGDPAAAPE